MPLVTTRELLLNAQKGGYAVCAFNTENMEMTQGILAAARDAGAPVIIQTTPGTVKYGGLSLFRGIAAALARESDIQAALHLDHGSSVELVRGALQAGYTSVMYDGSRLSLEENIRNTGAAVKDAASFGIPVEGELGSVPGKEDGQVSHEARLTDPETAARFVEETGVFSLAVAIGTAHGVYQETPRLDVARLRAIRERVTVPLVLHGASGLSEGQIQACIREGICKVNFATDLRIAYTRGIRETLSAQPDVRDPKVFGNAGRESVARLASRLIRVCGSQGRIVSA